MSQHIYDYAIIGSGLAGLALGAKISAETTNVILLEGADVSGGMNRPIQFPTGVVNNGLRHVADTAANREGIEFLENILGLKILRGSEEIPPITFEQGELHEFLGYGENPPEFYDQLKPFMNSKRLNLTLEPFAWPALLSEKFKGTLQLRSYVTRLVFTENEPITLTINGAKTIRATNVIYTGPVKSLAIILGDALNPRAKARLTKNTFWTTLCLDMVHKGAQTENTAIHLLNGTTQDEIGPSAGRFFAPVETENGVLQTSQWMTFLDEEVTEDSEIVGQSLKKMKRQIKRAYPQAFEGLIKERIVVAPMVSGTGDLKLNEDQTLADMPGLWLASAPFAAEPGPVAALSQAFTVSKALGFGASVETFAMLEDTDSKQEVSGLI